MKAFKGRVFTDEHRRKIGEKSKGKKASEETKRKIGEASRRRIPYERTEDIRMRMSESMKGKKHRSPSIEARKRMGDAHKGKHYGGKLTYQYTKDFVFVKKYRTLKDAAESMGVSSTAIMLCCRGKNKSAGGFIWTYTPIIRKTLF